MAFIDIKQHIFLCYTWNKVVFKLCIKNLCNVHLVPHWRNTLLTRQGCITRKGGGRGAWAPPPHEMTLCAGVYSVRCSCWILSHTHTPPYWSEAYHGVSMECWKICLFQLFLMYRNKIFWRHSYTIRISLLTAYSTIKLFQVAILLQTLILFASSFTPKAIFTLGGNREHL